MLDFFAKFDVVFFHFCTVELLPFDCAPWHLPLSPMISPRRRRVTMPTCHHLQRPRRAVSALMVQSTQVRMKIPLSPFLNLSSNKTSITQCIGLPGRDGQFARFIAHCNFLSPLHQPLMSAPSMTSISNSVVTTAHR